MNLPLRKKTKKQNKAANTRLPFDLSATEWKKAETPFVVTDLGKVKDNVANFKRLFPQVKVHYAVKANSEARVIQQVDKLVAGYDIASLGELNLLLKQGVNPSRILYSNPVKLPSHITGAYQKGVRYFAFDSVPEIEKLAKYAPGSDAHLRLKVSDYGSKFPLSKKFGIDQIHALEYCSLAQDAGLKVKGLAFHVGSQSENLQVWEKALEIAGKTIERLRNRGIYIESLNLGGGFPADYGDPVPALKDVALVINKSLSRFIPADINLIAEPGRYITADTSVLVATVICREHRSGSDWLYMDVGAFQGLIEPLEIKGWRYPIYTDKNPRGYKKDFVLSGPTCDPYDTIGQEYLLPSDINVGDRLYIGSVGAYTFVYASQFNGFEPPKMYFINGG